MIGRCVRLAVFERSARLRDTAGVRREEDEKSKEAEGREGKGVEVEEEGGATNKK